jgi:transcription elongation factor GreA
MSDERRSSASELMRALGLFVDGPVRWGASVPSRAPGVFVVELPGGSDEAPIDPASVRRWIERVPGMTVDGEPAAIATLARRLAEFWLPGEPVLYVGRAAKQVGGRVAALYATELGDAKPHSGGHWLKTLAGLPELRLWWAETDAHEEYEDALLAAVAERNAGRLPFANLAPAGSPHKRHGLDNSLRAEATGGPSTSATGAARAGGTKPRQAAARRPTSRPSKSALKAAEPPANAAAPTFLSREGIERLTAELDDLRTNVRPAVIARVAAARALGDLRENADYEYARKEQSFVEGRIQTIEQMLRTSQIIDDAPAAATVRLGATVVVDAHGERQTYALVGPAEADPANGRISYVSPVGKALLGAVAGDEVDVQLPAGVVRYRVIEVR